MPISDRIEGSIDKWSVKWGDKLKKWAASFVGWGFEIVLDVVGKKASPLLTPMIDKVTEGVEIPPELKPIIDEIKSPKGEFGALLANSAGGAVIGAVIGKVIDFILLPIVDAFAYNELFTMLSPIQLIALWLRKKISPTELRDYLHHQGYADINVERLKNLAEVRLDPSAVITLRRRYKEKWSKFIDDLKHQGWDAERIEAIDDATKAFPSLQDVITFYAKEAFEPDMIKRYGLLDELPPYEGTLFEKLGVPKEVANLYWIAHWIHASWTQVTEMLHRGLLSDKDVYEWYRVVEIPPYWRDKLTDISWDLPNRIELRMMARYGLVDKSFLIEQLKQVGLKKEFRDVSADMMLAMGIRTDLATRYSKGWITADEVKQELIDSGLSEAVRTRMFQWIVKNTATDRVIKERDLTKAEIIKGVKKGVITWAQGSELLQDMGFEEWEADFSLAINVAATEGSPEYFQEFKKITQLYRQSQGLSAKIPSEDIIQAEKDVIEAQKELDKAVQEKAPQAKLSELRGALESAKIRYHQLLKGAT